MANSIMSEEKMREAVALVKEHGNVGAAARAVGMPLETLRNRYNRAKAKGMHLDPAIQSSMAAVNTGMVPKLAWAKTEKDANGVAYSVLLKPEELPSDTLERIRDAFEGMNAAKPVKAHANSMDDLCSLYPLFDVHLGMHAWGRETGAADYDLGLATGDLRTAFARVMRLTPDSAEAILLIGGDFFHADDDNAVTPQSKHSLDVDGRQFKVLERGVAVLSEVIGNLLAKHQHVTIRILRGNHDIHSHMVLTFALAERYRDEPRVTLQKDPMDMFMFHWGRAAIFAHHGDKGKPQQMALYLSDICPFWSETRHRHLFTGHIHHDTGTDFGPIRHESLRAFCPPDAYGARFGGRRAMQAITFDKADGLVLRALDPIDRAA